MLIFFIILCIIVSVIMTLSNNSSAIKSYNKKEEHDRQLWAQEHRIEYDNRVKELGLDLSKALRVFKLENTAYPDIGHYFFMWCENGKLAFFADFIVPKEAMYRRDINFKNFQVSYFEKNTIQGLRQFDNFCKIDNTEVSHLLFLKKDYAAIHELLQSNGFIS